MWPRAGSRCLLCSVLSCVKIFVTSMDCAPPGPLSMEFSGQEYWSGLPFPSPGDLLDPGIKSVSPALVGRFLDH